MVNLFRGTIATSEKAGQVCKQSGRTCAKTTSWAWGIARRQWVRYKIVAYRYRFDVGRHRNDQLWDIAIKSWEAGVDEQVSLLSSVLGVRVSRVQEGGMYWQPTASGFSTSISKLEGVQNARYHQMRNETVVRGDRVTYVVWPQRPESRAWRSVNQTWRLGMWMSNRIEEVDEQWPERVILYCTIRNGLILRFDLKKGFLGRVSLVGW